MIFECSSSSLRILADVASSTLSWATRTKEALSTKISFFISHQDSLKRVSIRRPIGGRPRRLI